MRHPVRCCETQLAFHIDKDMIKLLDFKRKKSTGYQWFRNFAAQKNARMPKSTRAKMVTN